MVQNPMSGPGPSHQYLQDSLCSAWLLCISLPSPPGGRRDMELSLWPRLASPPSWHTSPPSPTQGVSIPMPF